LANAGITKDLTNEKSKHLIKSMIGSSLLASNLNSHDNPSNQNAKILNDHNNWKHKSDSNVLTNINSKAGNLSLQKSDS
jgi:hypothetical protein